MAETTIRGLRCHYMTLGEGPIRTVFIHGLLADNLSGFYMTLAPMVAERASALVYDLRGHGLSERPSSGYTVGDFVLDLDALLAALGVNEPFCLVGHSF